MSRYSFVLFDSTVRSAATGVNYTIAVKTGETTLLQHSWPISDGNQPNDVVVSDKNGVIFDKVSGKFSAFCDCHARLYTFSALKHLLHGHFYHLYKIVRSTFIFIVPEKMPNFNL